MVAATVLTAPLGAILLACALGRDSWVQVLAPPPRSPHDVEFVLGLSQACLRARVIPDPPMVDRRPTAAIQIPWIPLRHFVHGPSNFFRFRRQTQQMDKVLVTCSVRTGKEEENAGWDDAAFLPLLSAVDVQQHCACTGLVIIAAALASEIVAVGALRPNTCQRGADSGVVLLRRITAILYLSSGVVILAGLSQLAACCHAKLKLLVSEFLFVITDGDAAVWPADIELWPAAAAWMALCGGAITLMNGLLLLGGGEASLSEEADRVPARAMPVPQPALVPLPQLGNSVGMATEVAVICDEQEPATAVLAEHHEMDRDDEWRMLQGQEVHRFLQQGLVEQHLAATRSQLSGHGRRTVAFVLVAMVLFVVFLTAVGFVLGRRAIEVALQNALRGPRLTVKQTTGAFSNGPHHAKEALHELGTSLQELRTSVHGATQASLAAAVQHARDSHTAAVGRCKGSAVALLAAAQTAASSTVHAIGAHDWDALNQIPANVSRTTAGGCRCVAGAASRTICGSGRCLRLMLGRSRQPELSPKPPVATSAPSSRGPWMHRWPFLRRATSSSPPTPAPRQGGIFRWHWLPWQG